MGLNYVEFGVYFGRSNKIGQGYLDKILLG